MKRYDLLLLAVASAPLLVHSQPVGTSTAVTDANAAVPQLSYQSAFAEVKPAVKPQTTPDKIWVRSNQQVGEEESSNASPSMSMQMNHEPPGKGKSTAMPAAGADPHKGHKMNMEGH